MTQGDRFEDFWKIYPRRVGKLDAQKAWNRLKVKAELFGAIESALAWQVTSRDWTRDGGQFVPYPATWLRQGRWMDERPSGTFAAVTVTARERAQAEDIRRKAFGRCPHESPCGTYGECVDAIALARRAEQVPA